MQTARTVAFFATDIPFGNLLGFYVVIDGMTAVACWTRGSVKVAWLIKGDPPVGSGLDVIGQPLTFFDVPLGG